MAEADRSFQEPRAADRQGAWNHERIIAYANLVVSVLGLLGLLASIHLGLSSLDAAVQSANQARRQADEAQTANSIATQAIVAVQRAFISVKIQIEEDYIFNNVYGEIKNIKAYRITPVIINTGNTPTKNLYYSNFAHACGVGEGDVNRYVNSINLTYYTSSAQCSPYEPGDPRDAEQRFPGLPGGKVRAHIAPHAEHPVSNFSMPPELFRARKDFRWYFYGIVHYNDVFPYQNEHLFKYCYLVMAEPKRDGELSPQVFQCQNWNCADDECKDDRIAYDQRILDQTQALK